MRRDDRLEKILNAELSLARRVGYSALLAAGAGMAGTVALLWATEPTLPMRTHVGFALLVAIGIGWAAFAGWTLRHRRTLFARDRVIAAWIGLAASIAFSALGVAVASSRSAAAAVTVAMAGGLAIVASLMALRSARNRQQLLLNRLDELEGG